MSGCTIVNLVDEIDPTGYYGIMPLSIADRALVSINSELAQQTDHALKARRLAFLDQARRAIERGDMTSEQIGRVAERQSLLRGGTAKAVHRTSPMLRAINYADAALTIIVAQ